MTQTQAITQALTQDCCEEYHGLSRRGLLRGSLGAAALGGTTAAFGSAFVQTSYAASWSAPAVLVVLSMRGACDGLSLVVPHGDPVYYQARPRISVPADRLLARNAMFGLHPELAPLLPLWNAGKMAAVHATGLPAPNRSHFAAMEALEDADPGSSERIGWLNRLIGRDNAFPNALRAIHLGESTPPTSMYGPAPSASAMSVDNVKLYGPQNDPAGLRPKSLHTTWDSAPGPLGDAARAALQLVVDFKPVQSTAAKPANGATYPGGDLSDALQSAARTIRGDVGAEVISIDHGSWDMHAGLGGVDRGDFKTRTADFAKNLAAFFTDLGALASKVTVVCLSEFGRRVKENANQGTDHGHGGVMLLLGAGVKGGKYYGVWPGLVNNSDAEVTVTRDYRSVLAEVVSSRFGASPGQVFPGVALESIGAML